VRRNRCAIVPVVALLVGAMALVGAGPAAGAPKRPRATRAAASSTKAGSEMRPFNRWLLSHLNSPQARRDRENLTRMEALAKQGANFNKRYAAAAAAGEPDYGRPGCQAPPQYKVGDTESFFVTDPVQGGSTEKTAVLAAENVSTYVWVEQNLYVPAPVDVAAPLVSASMAEKIAEGYKQIYETDRSYFGHEPNPAEPVYRLAPGLPSDWRDADCDPHIYIYNGLIAVPDTGLSYTAGYYSSEHEYPRSEDHPFSAQHEMFFMNTGLVDAGSRDYMGILAHEFYHMIQFANDYNEESWVNEGMADIAAEVNGFTDIVSSHLSSFQSNPDLQLNAWGEGGVADYGKAYTFFNYLFEHYGRPDDPKTEYKEQYALCKKITQIAEDGFEGVDLTLASRGAADLALVDPYYRNKDHNGVFKDWLVTNILDDPSIDVGQYGYKSLDFKITPKAAVNSFPAKGGEDVHNYGGDYFPMDSSGDGTISATTDYMVPIVPALEGQPEPRGGYLMWGNRADEMLTWMDKPANLTSATAPHLKFSYWHQIEEDWDYAYLEVSTDSGKTWDYVPCCGGRNTNPNGNNRAVDESAGISGDSAGWKQADVDLSAYKGKNVVVRFEYDTDQALNLPGFVVDDVSLVDGSTQIWPKATFEGGLEGWTAGGDTTRTFLRIKPLTTERPLLTLVKVDSQGARVTRYESGSGFDKAVKDGKELWSLGSAAMDGTRVYAIFSGLTAETSETFTYAFEAKATVGALVPPKLEKPADEVPADFTLRWSAPEGAKPAFYRVEETSILEDTMIDDANSGIGKWEGSADTQMVGWGPTSTSPAVFQLSHEGDSFWTGPVATYNETPMDSTLTLKDPIDVPADGITSLTLWSGFRNDDDDYGVVEISKDGQKWIAAGTIKGECGVPTGDPTKVQECVGDMVQERFDLSRFGSGKWRLRLRMHVGGGQCCVNTFETGWYVDDIALHRDNWRKLGDSNSTEFAARAHPAGKWSFRVSAYYTQSFAGPGSNVEATRVKAGAVSAPVSRQLPATGGGLALVSLGALASGAALLRTRRRTAI